MHGIPATLQHFAPNTATALARVANIDPTRYAKTRNALDGDVTGLSPYITHGLISTAQVARLVAEEYELDFGDKLVFELAWREFFHHVWSRADSGGDAILADMRAANLWTGRYAHAVPTDVLEARTGVRAVDCAVRILYATGYLHNHARMWLASYCVHMRKVHWRAGADWMLSHLLDGDLASNHLSWQWVAGTFSSKPYLFNADNAAKFAPRGFAPDWDSKGSVIDTDYAELDDIARRHGDVGPEPEDSPVWRIDLFSQATELASRATPQPATFGSPHSDWTQLPAFDRAKLAPDTAIRLVHPWDLADRPEGEPCHAVGVIHLPAHATWPWSERRWRFVLDRLAACVDTLFIGDITQLAEPLRGVTEVGATHTLFPLYRQAFDGLAASTALQLRAAPRLLPNPVAPCASFTRFYERAQREAGPFDELVDV